MDAGSGAGMTMGVLSLRRKPQSIATPLLPRPGKARILSEVHKNGCRLRGRHDDESVIAGPDPQSIAMALLHWPGKARIPAEVHKNGCRLGGPHDGMLFVDDDCLVFDEQLVAVIAGTGTIDDQILLSFTSGNQRHVPDAGPIVNALSTI